MYIKYFILLKVILFLNLFSIYSQEKDKRLSLSEQNISLKELIAFVEEETDYSFVYDSELNLNYKQIIKIWNQPLESFLSLIFKNTNIDWEIKQSHIVLKKKNNKYTVSGYIIDKKSKESLIGATLIDKQTKRGIISNNYGFYSITLPEGIIELEISYIGYGNHSSLLHLNKDTVISFQMEESAWLTEAIIDERKNKPFNPGSGIIELTMSDIKNTPALMGEADIIKTLQLLPGVQTGVEGTSGLYVRGGSPDQNLTLLDGVNVYNINHIYGLFSIFNGDAVKKVTLYKGSFPARFGGRLSSVVDIRTKEGNMQSYKGDVSIGLISSHLNMEGPIIKDKTSFSFSARRTYIDAFIRLLNLTRDYDSLPIIYFYDLNAKINHRFSDKSRLYLSFYNGLDKMGTTLEKGKEYISSEKYHVKWGNTIVALRWNYLWNNQLFSNTTFAYNKYRFNYERSDYYKSTPGIGNSFDVYYNNYQFSGIEDWTLNVDFEYFPHDKHHIRFGGGYNFHTFQPEVLGRKQFQTLGGDTISNFNYNYLSEKMRGHETSLYLEDEITLTDKWKTNLGLHFSTFTIDAKNYWSLQPRLSFGYQWNDYLSIKTSYSEMSQYIHLLSSSTLSLPTDLWVPVTPSLPPMKSKQITLGGFYDIFNGYNFSMEGFYKKMYNMLEYMEGAEWNSRYKPWYEQVESGEGDTYGIEFFAQKITGRLTGWVGYTLAWNNRKFPTINKGKKYPAKYDRRHDIKINTTYKLSDKVDISAAWTFSSGNTYTLSLEEYPSLLYYHLLPYHFNKREWENIVGNKEIWIKRYEERNNYRIPPTHHLDVSVNYYRKKNEKGRQGIWNFTIYNVYNQSCPYIVYPEYSEKKGKYVIKQVSLLPILPSVSYTYKF